MKMNSTFPCFAGAAVLFVITHLALSNVSAQSPEFTYQGRLANNGVPAQGVYDFEFRLFDDLSAGTQLGGVESLEDVSVSNGLFTVLVDFGDVHFNGNDRYLDIAVRTNGGGAFTTLTPRQRITATPYAIQAASAGSAEFFNGMISAAQLPGTVITNGAGGINLTGVFSGDGAGLTNVNAATLGGSSSSNFWRTGGNVGTTPGTHFLGTTDNQAIEFKVNSLRAMRMEPNLFGGPNLIGGSPHNFVAAGVFSAVIAGGGATNAFGSGASHTNSVAANNGTISGGAINTIEANAQTSTIGGGAVNTIQFNAGISTIGGGLARLPLLEQGFDFFRGLCARRGAGLLGFPSIPCQNRV